MFTRLASAFLLSVLLGFAASAQESKTLTETFDFDADGRIVIDTYKGSITVTPWDRDEVELEARIEADEDEDLVEYTEIDIRHSGNTLRLTTDYEEAKRYRKGRGLFNRDRYSMSLPFAHYILKVPATTEVQIDDYKSEIQITGLTADVRLDTYKGTVQFDDLTGRVRLDTYKGDVRIRGLDGSLEADTYKGLIAVEFSELDGRSRFDTYRGDIEVTVPRNAGFDLDADLGRRGDLDTDLDLDQVRRNDDRLRAEINGGGPMIRFETQRGELRIAAMRL